MPSTYVARNVRALAVTEQIEARNWEAPQAPAIESLPAGRTPKKDELREARGILTGVLAGAAIWGALAWGAFILIDRVLG